MSPMRPEISAPGRANATQVNLLTATLAGSQLRIGCGAYENRSKKFSFRTRGGRTLVVHDFFDELDQIVRSGEAEGLLP